jgi:hypothetical protein
MAVLTAMGRLLTTPPEASPRESRRQSRSLVLGTRTEMPPPIPGRPNRSNLID